MASEQIGALIIRVTIGLLFVISAYVCSKDAAARQGAIADTALVFPWRAEIVHLGRRSADAARRLVGAARHLSPSRALTLTLFLIPAAMIHFRKASQAAALKDAMLARQLFKAWLSDISREVAEASMEGSFLGFGAMKVSDAERATLADIAESLGGAVQSTI